MAEKYDIFTLPNGIRLVVWQIKSLVSYFGAIVSTGSRDESPERQGLAHFVEHTIFKGTGKRKAWQISSRMESIGGELNAYTSKDETAVYTNAPAGHAERAIELVADLIADSRFPAEELEKEKDVVIEEIHSYEDSPADSVFDEFEELIYEGSGLAHNILGTPESVKALTSADCRAFIDSFYTPGEMTLYYAGADDPQRVARLVERHFSCLHFPAAPRVRTTPGPGAVCAPARPGQPPGKHNRRGTHFRSPRPAPPCPAAAQQLSRRPLHELPPQPGAARQARICIYGGKLREHV